MASLYQSLGGSSQLDRAVELFYLKVLSDPLLNHFFDGIDMDQQRFHQKLFLSYALGGMEGYDGRGLGKAHRRLVDEMGLNQVHFNAVLGHLEATLKALDIAPEDATAVMARVEATRDEVLGLDSDDR